MGVDEEARAIGEALLLEEHSVLLGHGSVRPEVGEQVELVALLLGEGALRRLRVDGNSDELDALVAEEREVVPQLAEFARAGAREGEGVEDESHWLLVAEVAEPDVFSELVGQFEVGCLGVILQSHVHVLSAGQVNVR